MTLIETRHLTKSYPLNTGIFHAGRDQVRVLEDINLAIEEHEVLGVIGEAGSGKSTLGRLLIDLLQPTSGQVIYDGQDLRQMGRQAQQRLRRETQIVFQNPATSFDPHFSVYQSLAEPLLAHGYQAGDELETRLRQLLSLVGFREDQVNYYPHELKNGLLQRAAVARALALRPRFVVLDDPLLVLEPMVQVQVLTLLRRLQQKPGFTSLFTSRKPVFAQQISHRMIVLLNGKVVESAAVDVFRSEQALHPYTLSLYAAPAENAPSAAGMPPNLPVATLQPALPSGCSFRLRCPLADSLCARQEPPLLQIGEQHWVACHRVKR